MGSRLVVLFRVLRAVSRHRHDADKFTAFVDGAAAHKVVDARRYNNGTS
ncbi:hypothetical protein [Amycolatopsis sp. DG1A-15b]|nr:hypothetical protein [Amycolatopsis sp. DG1A-15b]WIX91337.1 hypothetical protein QRY02_13150 [Amycolatopsis sp. DG1A-15b]